MSRYLLLAYAPPTGALSRPSVLIWEKAGQLDFLANAYVPALNEIDPVTFLQAFPRRDEELETYAEWVKALHSSAQRVSLPEIQDWVARTQGGAFHVVAVGELGERQNPQDLLPAYPAVSATLSANAVGAVVDYLVQEGVFQLGRQGVALDMSVVCNCAGAYLVQGKRPAGILALPLNRPVVGPRVIKRVRVDLAALRANAEHWLLLTNRGVAAKLAFGDAGQVLELGSPAYVEQMYAWLRQLG